MTARLVKASDDSTLWAHSYKGGFSRWFGAAEPGRALDRRGTANLARTRTVCEYS